MLSGVHTRACFAVLALDRAVATTPLMQHRQLAAYVGMTTYSHPKRTFMQFIRKLSDLNMAGSSSGEQPSAEGLGSTAASWSSSLVSVASMAGLFVLGDGVS